MNVSLILLAGGSGSRMGSSIPKQFININGKMLANYSLDVFLSIEAIDEIVIVCASCYQSYFQASKKTFKFALPGLRRQDSVFNGLQCVSTSADLVCIHDAARPYISTQIVKDVLQAADQYGAAALGMPMKNTVKQISSDNFVVKTVDRSELWEIQTPQVIKHNLLKEGFNIAYNKDLTVTDDVALVELLEAPVKIVKGSYKNIKVTNPDDLSIIYNEKL